MLKIVKSSVYSFDNSKPVAVGEKPVEQKKTENAEETPKEPVLTPEEEERLLAAEQEKLRRDEIKRFEAAVKQRSDEVILAKTAELEQMYSVILANGKNDAERMTEDAKVKAKAIMDAAEAEAQNIRRQAEQQGFNTGFEAGKKDAAEKCGKYLEAAARLLSEINSRKEAYYISHEYELCTTVLDMVKKITMAEIKTDSGVIDRIIANAAKNFRNSDYVKISVCRGEVSREMVTDKDFVKSLIPFIPEIEIEELDPEDAPPGTVVLDNGSEIIDASVPTQLDFLKEIMKNSRGGAGEE